MKAYLALKQDSELFVGEGTVKQKDFEDTPKALEAARNRARAGLAESIKVHVTSEIVESVKSEDGKTNEKIESKAQSKSDIELENVKILELSDFPEKGDLTVMASLSKESYRRQLAGKGSNVFVRENGLAATFGMRFAPWLKDRSDVYLPAYGGEVFWRGWSLGFNQASYQWTGGIVPVPKDGDLHLDLVQLSFGYDWTPWPSRLQAFFPLRANLAVVGGNSNATLPLLYGASAGVGLRFWFHDALAIDVSGSWDQGFNEALITPFHLSNGDNIAPSLTGTRLQMGLVWSSF